MTHLPSTSFGNQQTEVVYADSSEFGTREVPMKSVLIGSGIGLPPHVVTNHQLAEIMDTSDEWIKTRSGIEQRYFAAEGQGSAELGSAAARNAIEPAILNAISDESTW